MNRYSQTPKLRNTNEFVGTLGTQYYRGVTYPEIPLSETDIWVETEFGDRLDLIANQFYSDSTLYWIIAIANPKIRHKRTIPINPGPPSINLFFNS